jgi:Fic family protein
VLGTVPALAAASLLNRLLDGGIEGKLTSSKRAAIAKCSPATALRDIADLLTRGVLRKSAAGGRGTGYKLKKQAIIPDPPEGQALGPAR